MSNTPAGGARASSASPASEPSHIPPQDQSGFQDQDTGDIPAGVDEDALNDDPLDTGQITSSD